MSEKICSKCGQPMVYKQGNKNGKPWAAWFCADKDFCNNVEWVKLHNGEQSPKPATKPQIKTGELEGKKENTLIMARTDLMCAIIEAGILERTEVFKEAWKVIENG